MTKTETITFEYEHCGGCPNVLDIRPGKWKCMLGRREIIHDIWGKIPDWCPLPDKEK